ncbi:deoxyribodipyrimidine photo-lyase [Streptomyces filipinensis]|uniref:deoxyribodipyrimidine photo-lyase n=1 Tax=Streptomyces filipinensis TaxID=66887 RepID=UPI0036F13AC7
MRVSAALFTADLGVHDNPVLQAAVKDADRVVPLFVVDTGIRRTGFAGPDRAAFSADSRADRGAQRGRGEPLRGTARGPAARGAGRRPARTTLSRSLVDGRPAGGTDTGGRGPRPP